MSWDKEAVGTLRKWALIADSIASMNCNMHQRAERIETFLDIVEDYCHINRPVWHETLIELLEQTRNKRLAFAHHEVRGMLILFQLICHHVASNYDKWWLAWVQEPIGVDEEKTESPSSNADAFGSFLDTLDYLGDTDEDDSTKS